MREERASGAVRIGAGRRTPRAGPARLPRWLRLPLIWLLSPYCWLVLLSNTLFWYAVGRVWAWFADPATAYGWILYGWARCTLFACFFRVDVAGAEHLARPAVLAANHQDIFDIILLAAIVPPPMVFVARVEVRKVPIVGSVLERGGHILVKRGAGSANDPVLEEAVRRLAAGSHVVFFPEGSRSRDGKLRPFRSGALRVAARAGRPLVPVALAGTRVPLPRGTPYIIPARVAAAFLPARRVDAAMVRSEEHRERLRGELAAHLQGLEQETGPRI